MGGSNSTRRVVIQNASDEIAISTDVVDRLEGKSGVPSRGKGQQKDYDDIAKVYEEKIKELGDRNKKILSSSAEEFARAVEDVEKKFMKTTGSPVCQDLQEKVYRCYVDNHKQTLLCSSVVKDFMECVEKARQNAMLKKG